MSRKFLILLVGFMLLLDGFALGIVLYDNVFEKSYVSVMSACDIWSEQEINNRGFSIGGFYTPDNNQISIVIPVYSFESYMDYWEARNRYIESDEYNMIVRHEKIHRSQAINGRFGDCNHKIRLFVNELEAYFFMRFPQRFFDFVYG